MKHKEAIKILEKNGFKLIRSTKHLHYKNDALNKVVMLPHHQAKGLMDYTIREIKRIVG